MVWMCMNTCEQMVSHRNYDLNGNEDYVMFLTSKLITYITDSFTSGTKSQSTAYLLSGSVQTNILDFGFWKWNTFNMDFVDKQPLRMQEHFFNF